MNMSHTHRQRVAYLLLLIAISCSTILGSSLLPGYSLFSNPTDRIGCEDTIEDNVSTWQRLHLFSTVSVESGPVRLFWNHGLQAGSYTEDYS